ncbi:MAG TPA: DNA glycosylase [Verrucomicrobiae bacterium]|nr:DNA glycosylase [Verrucomicrobiae bacterium]
MKFASKILLPVRDYDLAATLDSGQVFRWQQMENSWIGVVGENQVRLTQTENGILAQTVAPQKNWDWLREFLQTEIELETILKSFPDDEPMNRAVVACRGLRILRQEPWECLASFILSSTKQIVQIRQIIVRLCERFGEPLIRPSATFSPFKRGEAKTAMSVNPATRACNFSFSSPNEERAGVRSDSFFSFPSAKKIASLSERQLRACKMGFRAPHLLAAARQIAEGKFDLEKIRELNYAEAQHELMKLRGVGHKIADCVLLFAYGFDSAFPVDVWVERALRQLYFPRRRISEKRLKQFAATHFGPHAGYAQQYLFHYMRTKMK